MPTFETSDPEQGLFYDAPSVHAPTGFDGVGYHPTSRLCRAPETRFFVTRSRMREHWRTQTIAEGRGIGRQEDAGRGVVPPPGVVSSEVVRQAASGLRPQRLLVP